MTETRKLSLFCTMHCTQYDSEAKFFILDKHPSGLRHLIVQYAKGGYQGLPEFATAIPHDWSLDEISNFLLMNTHEGEYPAWEIPARAYDSSMLFRWWKGEKPD
jgi:hypothetical protein